MKNGEYWISIDGGIEVAVMASDAAAILGPRRMGEVLYAKGPVSTADLEAAIEQGWLVSPADEDTQLGVPRMRDYRELHR